MCGDMRSAKTHGAGGLWQFSDKVGGRHFYWYRKEKRQKPPKFFSPGWNKDSFLHS